MTCLDLERSSAFYAVFLKLPGSNSALGSVFRTESKGPEGPDRPGL